VSMVYVSRNFRDKFGNRILDLQFVRFLKLFVFYDFFFYL
jgi:hypothetical protein